MNSTGLFAFGANLELNFNIVNQTTVVKSAFGILISLNMQLNASVNQASKLFLNSTILHHSEVVSTTYTNVGSIVGDAFSQLVDLIFSIIKLPGFEIPIPASLVVSAPEMSFGANYLQIGMNYNYNLPLSSNNNSQKKVNNDISKAHHYKFSSNSTHFNIKPAPKAPDAVQLCGDGSGNCPSGQTCCKTSAGLENIKYGCCPYPNAVCCGSSCETWLHFFQIFSFFFFHIIK